MLRKADDAIAPALTSVIKIQQIDDAIAEAIKGKKSLVSIDTATAQVLQTWSKKIQDSEAFLLKRLAKLPQDKLHLFPDVQQLLTLDTGFEEAIAARIEAEAERQAQEQARLEAEAEAKARAKIEAEQTMQATQAETSNSALEQERPAGTWYAEAVEYADVAVTPPQTDAPQDNYKILLTCSLEQAKAIAKAVKEQYPQAFKALKKGE